MSTAKLAASQEPSGKSRSKIKPGGQPRFVVQKHAARQLHYDLRLEHDGVFKSWAVAKGPSCDPRDKRLAVEVEDHPLDYGDFEGTIPEGEYGAGTVMLWDRGFWQPQGNSNVAKALRQGELKFSLVGDKLKGGWVLVRMKGRDRGRRNWLLIKHRDDFACKGGEKLLDDDHSVASGRNLEQIAAGTGGKPKPFMSASQKSSSPANPSRTAQASGVASIVMGVRSRIPTSSCGRSLAPLRQCRSSS